MITIFSHLILLCLGAAVASEVAYFIRPSSYQSNAECVDNNLTLSQFVDKSTDYLKNDTRLIFSPGTYSLESELTIENVHSFSILVDPISSSKATIVCGINARFAFNNVSTVTLSELEFVECFRNDVVSVSQFRLKNSAFFGNGQAIINGTVLTIEETVAYLDRVVFSSIVDAPPWVQELKLTYPKSCTAAMFLTMESVIGILLKRSSISITQSWFEGNSVGPVGGIIYDEFGSTITIINTTFVNNSVSDYFTYCNIGSGIVCHGSTINIHDSIFVQNVQPIIFGDNASNIHITHTKFVYNSASVYPIVHVDSAILVISHSTFMNNTGFVLRAWYTNVSISCSEFIGNINEFSTVYMYGGVIINIDRSKFMNNTGSHSILCAVNTNMLSITYSEFVNNNVMRSSDPLTVTGFVVYLEGDVIIMTLSSFTNNRVSGAVVYIPYIITAENLTNNVFLNNGALYEIYIHLMCRPGLGFSLGSQSRCIQCTEHWHLDLIEIAIAGFLAGIALVIFMLALNMTVAVGTLNGILFYANIVAANADTYFLPFTTPNFATVFISWLNLDIGFDICFVFEQVVQVYKALLQIAFPAYVILLVIFVIVASECSSKFAKIIGKGNPVAVLATMFLLSYAKFLNIVFVSFTLLYLQPAPGSHSVDVTKLDNILTAVAEANDSQLKALSYILFAVSILVLLLGIVYSVLVFSWQWLLQYQDKVIFKWVKYQKLHHFLEPYHAPYTTEYRYWTGLLLFARVLLYLISALNFSLNPRVDLMAVIIIVGGLILIKGVTAKRVYKDWPLDVMETAIYFNLVAFSTLTWYNLDFGGNQVAVAYTSVLIIFILLLGVIVFHILRYTRLYKCSFVAKAYKGMLSKLIENKPKRESPNDISEELDGYWLVRPAAGDHVLSTVTHSELEIH